MKEFDCSPETVIAALDDLAGVYSRVDQKRIVVANDSEIILSGGSMDHDGGSWSARSYKLELSGRMGSVIVEVSADLMNPKKPRSLVLQRGDKIWYGMSNGKDKPPKWVRKTLGAIGVGFDVKL